MKAGANLEHLLSYGFRPFFLLGASWAPVGLATLVVGLAQSSLVTGGLPLLSWHGHEMLFGYVLAAVAGFLLTAVPTWTSTRALSGLPLAGLALLWIAGRVALYPVWHRYSIVAALADLLFLPVLIAVLAVPLVKSRNVRNYPFLLLLTMLLAANACYHSQRLGWVALPFDPLRITADIVMMMIVVVGGRIVPAFTRNALVAARKASAIRDTPRMEITSLAAVAAVIVADLLAPFAKLSGALALLAAVLLGVRLSRWEGMRALRMPIVFVLHVGYAWVVIALLLKGAFLLASAPWAGNWFHALTAGAFGTMILAVATRVALGHSGRPLRVRPVIAVAYVLVSLGAILRIWGPLVLPSGYLHVIACAALLWIGAYLIFLFVYVPILLGPRADVSPPASVQ